MRTVTPRTLLKLPPHEAKIVQHGASKDATRHQPSLCLWRLPSKTTCSMPLLSIPKMMPSRVNASRMAMMVARVVSLRASKRTDRCAADAGSLGEIASPPGKSTSGSSAHRGGNQTPLSRANGLHFPTCVSSCRGALCTAENTIWPNALGGDKHRLALHQIEFRT